MADSIEIRELVKTFLNNNLVDPLSDRKGVQFYSDIDGFNFSRKDTFPKGYIEVETIPVIDKSNYGNSGYAKYKSLLTIYYYNVIDGKYNTGKYTIKDNDVCNHMLNQVVKLLNGHYFTGYHNFPTQFGEISSDGLIDTGNFKLYQSSVTIQYYWYEAY